eukprot:Lithocolla_globosa_v1_NODE_753_length_3331_cov_106.581197.p1 type:complete len:271 gc:universal NODE_753_length_3331_cov_106.581197:1832-2644(+)
MVSAVKVGQGRRTHFFSLTDGVRQGSLLSPLFFLVFTVDLFLLLIKTGTEKGAGVDILGRILSVLGMADDIALLANSPEQLQELIDVCGDWAHRWGLTYNLKKCGILRFSSHPIATKPSFTIRVSETCRDVIPWVDRYRYLGLFIGAAGGSIYTVSLRGRINAAKAGIDWLLPILLKCKPTTQECMEVYLLYISPILDYGCEALDLSHKELESMDLQEEKLITDLEAFDTDFHCFSTRWKKARRNFLNRITTDSSGSWREYIAGLLDLDA